MGLYGVLAFNVAQRRFELGVRAALGASAAALMAMVVGSLVIAAAVAAWIPSLRATRVNPAAGLRAE